MNILGLKLFESKKTSTGKRMHERRDMDGCICVFDGKPLPVENWSLGGALLRADGRLFAEGQNIDITLRFKIRDHVINISHQALIIRRSREHIAIRFFPLKAAIKKTMQNVIDHMLANEFANSQNLA